MHTLSPPPTYSNLLPSNQGQTRGNSYFRFEGKAVHFHEAVRVLLDKAPEKHFFLSSPQPPASVLRKFSSFFFLQPLPSYPDATHLGRLRFSIFYSVALSIRMSFSLSCACVKLLLWLFSFSLSFLLIPQGNFGVHSLFHFFR